MRRITTYILNIHEEKTCVQNVKAQVQNMRMRLQNMRVCIKYDEAA